MKKTIILLPVFLFILSACNEKSTKTADQTNDCTGQKKSSEFIMNIPKKVKPEYVSIYKVFFEKCQEGTLKEEACIEYKMFQSFSDSTEFHIYERWTNEQGQKDHTKTEHFKEFIKATEGIFDESPVKAVNSYVI